MPAPGMPARHALSTWLTVRGVGLAFFLAFASLWGQVEGLLGEGGIVPAAERLERLEAHPDVGFWDVPTLAWWTGASNGALHLLAGLGAAAALLLMLGVLSRMTLLLSWLCYLSLVHVGAPFTSFQWDALLLETGFVALVVAPWSLWSPPSRAPEPSRVGRWLLYLLLFKLMFSSGVVKIASGDPTWRDLSALGFHYETQPLPHVIGWWVHHLPAWFHAASAAGMLLLELLAPFLILWPGRPRLVAFGAFVALQLLIAGTGNYGFFNLLSIVLCIPLLQDAHLVRLAPRRWRDRVARLAFAPGGAPTSDAPPRAPDAGPLPTARWRRRAATAFAVMLAVPCAAQLIVTVLRPPIEGAAREAFAQMGAFRTFNRYGLFAVMTTERPEIVLEGSDDGTTWKEYGFRHKPGALDQAPGWCAPHMPRLDWQMWFAALGDVRRNPWLLSLMRRILEGEPRVLELLADNPFPREPPRFLRAVRYRYRFTDPATLGRTGQWWRRERLGLYAPVMGRRADDGRPHHESHRGP